MVAVSYLPGAANQACHDATGCTWYSDARLCIGQFHSMKWLNYMYTGCGIHGVRAQKLGSNVAPKAPVRSSAGAGSEAHRNMRARLTSRLHV